MSVKCDILEKELNSQSKWCLIRYKGKEGWVNQKFLKEGGVCANTPYTATEKSVVRITCFLSLYTPYRFGPV